MTGRSNAANGGNIEKANVTMSGSYKTIYVGDDGAYHSGEIVNPAPVMKNTLMFVSIPSPNSSSGFIVSGECEKVEQFENDRSYVSGGIFWITGDCMITVMGPV